LCCRRDRGGLPSKPPAAVVEAELSDLERDLFTELLVQLRDVNSRCPSILNRLAEVQSCLVGSSMMARRPYAAVALANKMVRTIWALLVKGGTYQAPAMATA
jgi:hypothetical protein